MFVAPRAGAVALCVPAMTAMSGFVGAGIRLQVSMRRHEFGFVMEEDDKLAMRSRRETKVRLWLAPVVVRKSGGGFRDVRRVCRFGNDIEIEAIQLIEN